MDNGVTSIRLPSTTQNFKTPNQFSEKMLLHVASSRKPNQFEGLSDEVKTNSSVEGDTNSASKLKIDLSVVSFLKPHIVNEDVYKLAHKGFSRDQQLKTDILKSIEQERRFKRFLGTYKGRNNQQHQHVTASSFPRSYQIGSANGGTVARNETLPALTNVAMARASPATGLDIIGAPSWLTQHN